VQTANATHLNFKATPFHRTHHRHHTLTHRHVYIRN